jgi:hypothetical protein
MVGRAEMRMARQSQEPRRPIGELRAWLAAALGIVLLVVGSGTASSQDPVPLYPENYKILFENDRVRVLDFRLRKGATEKLHSHPANVTVKIRFTLPDGETKLREARAGDAAYSEATTHSPVNLGEDAHGIIVEMKTPPAGAGR